MKTLKNFYSVVIPVFNSHSSLRELFHGISETFRKESTLFEVIFVDDFSQDGSWEVLMSLQRENPGLVRAIRLARNFGQHNATLCGLTFARGDRIITIDDDLQTPPAEINKLIVCREEHDHDLVYGISRLKHHSMARNLGSRSLKVSARTFHQSRGEGSSFRLISRELCDRIILHRQNFIFLDEVMQWYTDDIGFTEVEHLPRRYDRSGYSFAKLFSLLANIVLYYTMMPLKLLVYGGLAISFVTFLYGLFFIFKKIVFDVPLGYTSLIVTILFSTSIILFGLGVLGEYLSRMYQIQNGKPPYSIKRVSEDLVREE